MWKKTVIGIIAALIVVGAAIYAVNHFADKPTDNTETEISQTETEAQESDNAENETPENESAEIAQEEPDKEYIPTFMYFVSNSDSDFEKTNKMLEELKKEYDGRVNFDIRNIDVTPEDKENFPVDNNTPILIMLNKSNDISAFNPKCNDKETLRAEIETALQ